MRRIVTALFTASAMSLCLFTAMGSANAATLRGFWLSAAAAPSVTCPTVAAGTGTVTPAPGPGVDWAYCDLRSADLIGADFTGANLTGANMVGSVLSGANLTSVNLAGVNLNRSVLSGANLTTANLAVALMYNADLSNADLAGATLTDVASSGITGEPLSLPANWSLLGGFLIGPGAQLGYQNLSGLDLSGLDLAGIYLGNANLSGTQLIGTNLTSASLACADLNEADLAGATLTGVSSVVWGVDGQCVGITGTPTALPANWILIGGFLIGPGANLGNVVILPALNLSGVDLAGANLTSAALPGTQLAEADLAGADLAGADLANVSLAGAVTAGANFSGVLWSDTICPDGSNSNSHVDGCFSALDTSPPIAHPVVTSGKAGTHGWYISPVTVTWDWTDSGTIITSTCTATSTATTSGKAVTITASCTDLAGNTGHASMALKIDQTRPEVHVTGVRNHHRYRKGHVPVAGCRTTESISGVARPAKLTITTTGRHGLGRFTVTCSGAVSVAGTRQKRPQAITYIVVR